MELDPRVTVLCVDAVGAFDHVSRQAMLAALLASTELRPLLPYARQFFGAPRSYTWTDRHGCSHDIAQGEGGEQGETLMPALYSLAQHPALEEVQAQLPDGEANFAYLDDRYVLAPTERVQELYAAYERALWAHARVELNCRKTRVWNAAGEDNWSHQAPNASCVWQLIQSDEHIEVRHKRRSSEVARHGEPAPGNQQSTAEWHKTKASSWRQPMIFLLS